jgi:hypothetical protein
MQFHIPWDASIPYEEAIEKLYIKMLAYYSDPIEGIILACQCPLTVLESDKIVLWNLAKDMRCTVIFVPV